MRAQTSGAKGQNESQPVAPSGGASQYESPVNGGDRRALANCVATTEMERVEGIEPS